MSRLGARSRHQKAHLAFHHPRNLSSLYSGTLAFTISRLLSPSMTAGTKRSASLTSSISPPPLKRKVESTVTSRLFFISCALCYIVLTITGKTVAAFFTPTSKKKSDHITWRIVGGSLVIGKYAPAPDDNRQRTTENGKQRVAAFDLVCLCLSQAY